MQQAPQQSQLTQLGGKPFHFKVTIKEKNNSSSDYQATIEEYWLAPTKWRREIASPVFSQTLVVNGDAISEMDKGNYFPFWLNSFVIAATDRLPVPMLEAIKKVNMQIEKPHGSVSSTACADLPARVDRWVICFEGSHGLFSSVFTKGYFAEFKDYKKFGNQWVAQSIFDYPESGTTIEARVTELTDLIQPSEQMFQVDQPIPPNQRIKSVRISEEAMRQLSLVSTDIAWPAVGQGLVKRGCAVYVSADRAGQVQEVWPEGVATTPDYRILYARL